MSKSKHLHKDPAFCSKCYFEYKLRCPICLKFKIKRHCKLHPNPSSLHWHLQNSHRDFVSSKFSTDDARFGQYYSKDAFDGRLKLDIKPTKRSSDGVEGLRAIFNFHRDIESGSDDVKAVFSRWSEVLAYVNRLAVMVSKSAG